MEPDLTARVRALYEDSAVPVREIANMAGVTERTIYKYARKLRWKPRYAWMPDGSRPPGRSARSRWSQIRQIARAQRYAPAKGAGGRFIRRGDKGKPFAQGLKATDRKAAARAAAQCRAAERLAREAQAEAETRQRADDRLRALAGAARALRKLADYRKERAKAWDRQRAMQQPLKPAPDDDLLERALCEAVEWTQEILRIAQEADERLS